MESRQSTQSVMARLMGIDQVPRPQKSIHQRKQVFSESYRRRVASIGVGKKRSFHECHSSMKSLGSLPQTLIELQASSESIKSGSGWFRSCDSKRSSMFSNGLHVGMKSWSTRVPEDIVDTSRKSRRRSERLEPHRKIEDDTSRSQIVTRNEALSGNKRFRKLKPIRGESKSSDSGVNKRTEFANIVDQRVGVEQENRNVTSCDDRESIGLLEELGRRTRLWETKGLSSGFSGGDTYVTKSEVLTPTRNMDELFVKQGHVSRMRNDKLGVGRPSIYQTRYEAFRSKWNLRSEKPINWERLKLTKHSSYKNKDGSEPKYMKLEFEASNPYSRTRDDNGSESKWVDKEEMKNNVDSILSGNSVCEVPDMVLDTQIAANNPTSELESKHLESPVITLLEEDVDCSVQQKISIDLHEESSGFSCCPRMELDSLVILEEAHDQQSPVSVLELPFSQEDVNGAEFLKSVKNDINGLELLRSETLETSSEGPGMAALDSSDDESEAGLAPVSIKEEASMKICGVEEYRNFSYLLQVITMESLNEKSLAEFGSWHSLEFPISRSVFETLEKKSIDEISWTRSERKLLFDRINAGLVRILLPSIGVPTWENSVSRRFGAIRDESAITEDLWKLLASQEKKRSKSSEENVLGSEMGKIELGDEINEIGREIERLLFDELLAELFVLA